MHDAATYAATRLREIKAEPERWNEPSVWRAEYATANSGELQREVLGLARQVDAEALLAVLPVALAANDRLTRLDAAQSIALLPENRLATGVMIGVNAPDEEIRAEVMEIAADAPEYLKPEILRSTLASASFDVQQRTVELVCAQPSPELFELLIEWLPFASDQLRPILNQSVASLTAHSFTDFTEAQRWWAENHARFDQTMIEMP